MNTCTVDNCAQKVIARGWRSTHYGRWRRNGDPTIAHREVTCAQCGKRFTTNTAGARAYCTDLCLVEARNSRRSTAKAARRSATTKACALCGTTFSPARSMKQKYCTAKCTASASRDASGKTCTVDDCARPVRARGMCSMHYKRWARAEGLLKPEPWDDRRKNNHHLRRARMIGNGPYEMVTIDALMARDHDTCNVCDGHIDPTLEWPNPMSKSIDHIIALSRGGEHTMNNTAPSHLICNVRKNDKDIDEARLRYG